MQKKFDQQFRNQTAKINKKERNYNKANGIQNKKIQKQGNGLPNLAMHKKTML
jgi:hypothetical protein